MLVKTVNKNIMPPFKSIAQERWAYSKEGTKALGGKKKVAEWQKETPKKLPKRVKKKR